jgi:uncharacterized protein YqiB (DUF1249 family)|tara:strand:+ start:296 stop:868 length:573 start_codon:yes stop_codon:yes gene_type:complete
MPKSRYSVDLIKQMAECDANYIRLLKLVPQLQSCRNPSRINESLLLGRGESSSISDENESVLPHGPMPVEGDLVEFCIANFGEEKGNVRVEIHIAEVFKYTTTLEISQKPELKKWMTNPSMLVRVYHDASTAEVISYQGHRNLQSRYPQLNSKMYHADEKMQVNKFLGEWLSHCLKVGRSIKVPDIILNS